jgi:hypothetical protein
MIDPDGGFLCLSVHWRPDPQAADPEMPGHKLSMSSYIPVFPRGACLCGSSKRYGDCCQPKHLWHPICPNPGGRDSGYSLVKPQKAIFRNVDGDAIRERLTADRRLRCTDTSRASAFWIFFGEPPVEDQYGILCFGDFELEHNHTLVVTGMSDLRMQTLLALLQEIVANVLEEPRITYDTLPVIDKRTGKSRVLRPSQSQPSRRRSKRKRRRR